jgi:sortase A
MTEVDVAEPTSKQPQKRRRGIGFWIGLGMLLAGLAIVGWLLWEFFGTNIVARRDMRHNVQLFEKGSKLTDARALVKIPRFGKKYVVPVYAGVSTGVLAHGLGHFKGTADPGQVGNYALAGHRVTHGQPLHDMPDLRPGDKVVVITHGTTYTYVLDTNPNDLIVSFTALWVTTPDPTNPDPDGVQPPRKYHRLITLTTCSEIFHTDNRMIAFGHLVSSHPNNLG